MNSRFREVVTQAKVPGVDEAVDILRLCLLKVLSGL